VNVVATIEARTTSSRLPGKVLREISGKPMLQHVIERAQRIRGVDRVVVATTTNATDDPIVALADRLGALSFRGSEDDVLQRLADALVAHDAGLMVKVTGDMPLLDPELVEAEIEFFRRGNYDYVSEIGMKNSSTWQAPQTFPLGFGAEIVNPAVLIQVARTTTDRKDREHPGRYIVNRPSEFTLGAFQAEGRYAAARRPDVKLAVNTDADLAEVRRIFAALDPTHPGFGILDVMTFLERPSVV
jgi:spore coat polysaccharide biosynthesis protein SpsF